MSITREEVDALLNEIFDQVPTMTVKSVTVSPSVSAGDKNVIARIDVSNNRLVVCEISSEGRLQSARVLET
ncbi:hypothetical protein ACUSIJ_18730 [Pseudochelatococcus sp. B33]